MADSSVVRGPGRNKRPWTTEEDAKLIDALMEVHVSGKYSGADNGFKPGYLKAVEQLLEKSLPNSGIKAEPHIKSRMKTLKSNFTIVHDMIVGTSTSGFGFKWDSGKGCIDAEEQVWEEYIKTHKNAAGFKGKPLPFYEKLCTIFGKDRATGSHAVDLGEEDAVEETPTSPIEVDMDISQSGGVAGSASNKRKRSKSDDFSEIFKECSSDLTERIEHSIGSLGEKIVVSAHETIAADVLEEVITEIQSLPGISAHQRLKGMDIIGCNTSKAHIFLRSSEQDKVLYIQMLANDALD
uniref:uncharacterized protein LOC122599569 n=1 Tax=Erigeron canadensis TaxID=72917 RepID=UPI001CB9A933|nr:uncharacterized protein LOC122599569 [Erigeron canadensis]